MLNIRRVLPFSLHWRVASFAMIALVAALALGARCIDRTNVYVDKDGYTHITGELVNDTDIQGVQIMLRGTLFDAQGNVIAQKDAPTCPPDTQPHQQIIFDIRFDNPNVPPYARYDVHVVSGRALSAPLPDPDVVVLGTDAARFEGLPPIPGLGITSQDVLFAFDVRNRSGHPYTGVQGCAAVYDNTGKVIAAKSSELIQQDATGHIQTATLGFTAPETVFMIARDVPRGPVQVRAWLWFGDKGAPTSQYQFVPTPFITIQTITAP